MTPGPVLGPPYEFNVQGRNIEEKWIKNLLEN